MVTETAGIVEDPNWTAFRQLVVNEQWRQFYLGRHLIFQDGRFAGDYPNKEKACKVYWPLRRLYVQVLSGNRYFVELLQESL